MSRLRKRFMDCSGLSIEEAEQFGSDLAQFQRDLMFWLGDLARYSEAKWGETHHQVWPDWVSPGMLARAAGVAKAYPTEEDRRHEATFTQYMQVANKPDRHALLGVVVDKGMTTDESRAKPPTATDRPRWLLAIDVHYFLHKWWYSGAGVEAAVGVATWVQRTVERLKEKHLTDVVCCFDSTTNHRKALTEGDEWAEARYKDRGKKDVELVQQLQLVRELLSKEGFACCSIEGMEADDVMASFAAQFGGNVTILTQDKDLRQCLSDKCNLLLDVEWTEDETSGDMLPTYKWMTAKAHTESTGIRPDQWVEFQKIAGDPVDGIKGVAGIGEKGSADLVKQFGTVEAAIEAAKAGDESIREKKRTALIEFEGKLDVTRQLVTLRNDLPIQSINTRLI